MNKTQDSSEERFLKAFYSTKRVEGYTHQFYRYPARFNPEFVRKIIQDVTQPNDVVLDPFMGGGTAIVETLALGRLAIGMDINELAYFITKVKTTPLSEHDIHEIRQWLHAFQDNDIVIEHPEGDYDLRARNLPDELRQFLLTALNSLNTMVRFPRQRQFIQCALLRTGQWALESNTHLPTLQELVRKLQIEINVMFEGLNQFVMAIRRAGISKNKMTASRTLVRASADELIIHRILQKYGRSPKLVITSPPYPGVHVLYHRWQVHGRRETPAPYWVAGLQDGHGASFYTMGNRSPVGRRKYFIELQRIYKNLKEILSTESLIIQLVAFSQTEEQLPLFQEAMSAAGYEEAPIPNLSIRDKPVRTVPNRKWYTYKQAQNDASQEVLLVHRICR